MTCFGEIATYCWESTTPTINKGYTNNKTGRQAATAKGEWGVVAHSCHLLWITSAIDPNGTVWNVLIPQLPTDYHHFSKYFQKKATEKMWWFNLWHWEAKADEETYEAWPEEWARRVTCRCFVIQCWRLPPLAMASMGQNHQSPQSGWFNKTPSTKKDQPCRSTKNTQK